MSGPLLIVGGDSMIGGALSRRWIAEGRETMVTTRRVNGAGTCGLPTLDLAADDLEDWPLPKCSTAVFCAAITSLEQCSCDPIMTRRVNVVNAARLIERFQEAGVFVMLLSTSMVFDGSVPHTPADSATCPLNEYGSQKRDLEDLLTKHPTGGAVVRLTKVLHRDLGLLRRWHAALSEGHAVDAFEDYVCAPLGLDAVVEGLSRLLLRPTGGKWQFSAPDEISYAQMARRIAVSLGQSQELVRAGSCARVLENVPRSATLDTTRAHSELGIEFATSAATIDTLFATFS
jgi:dTDP-4-dehydrorhamnose reductase